VALECFPSELLKDRIKAGEKRAPTLLNLEEKVRAVMAIPPSARLSGSSYRPLHRIKGEPHFASTRR